MINVGQKLYDSTGHEIVVNKIDNNIIFSTKRTKIKVTFNNGMDVEYQERDEQTRYNITDIGTSLFYDPKDIENHRQLLIENSCYLFNKDKIIKHFEDEYNKIKSDIQNDEPSGPIMSDGQRENKVLSYYSKKDSLQEEIEFHNKNNVTYFGRIDLDTHFFRKNYRQYLDNHYYDKIYITAGLYHRTSDGAHIVNWRAPIASLYYDNEKTTLTSRHYVDVVNKYLHGIEVGNRLNVYQYELLLKRNYPSLDPLKYNNTYITGNEFFSEGSADSFLIEVLIENRSNHKITDIIKSIQSNQNKIIRENKDCNIIVQGCAGSGKTMILLHRLSYLKFNSALPALNKIKIITPNKDFSIFINDLAISLELEKIERITMIDYYISIVNRYQNLYTTTIRKNVQGECLNEIEVKYNKKVQLLLKPENFNTNNESNKISESYFGLDFIEQIEKEYNLAKNTFFDNIAEDKILAIAHKLNCIIDKNIVISDKNYLDMIFNWCIIEFGQADKKLHDDIETLEYELHKLEKSDKQIKLLYEKASNAKRSLNCISRTINFISEAYNRVSTNHNTITQLEKLLLEIKKLATYKSNLCEGFENSKHDVENKIKILDTEIKDLTQKLNTLSFYQIIQKKSIINHIYTKEEEKRQLLSDIEVISSQNEREMKTIINTAYNLISNILPNVKKSDLIENYFEQIYQHIQTNKKAIAKDMPIGMSSVSDYFIKCTIETFEKNKSFVNVFSDIKYPGKDLNNEILKLKTEYNKYKNELINYINSFKNNPLDLNKWITKINEKIYSCTSVLLHMERLLKLEEPVNGSIHSLNATISDKKLSLLNESDLIVINNACLILNRRGLFVIELFEKLKKDYGHINTNSLIHGKHELILLIFIYYLHCGKLKNSETFLFVDEGQDYSTIEYRLLNLVNGENCVFNIFGDVNQCINIKTGIESWDSISKFLKSNNYVLDENYRNSIEITNFTNKKFDLHSLPIGVHGPVVNMINHEEVNSELKKDIKSEDNIRIAIISKDNEFILQLKNQYIDEKNLFFGNVVKAKGLEFDNVYVDLKDMNKSEQYISCTRALNKLIIIK